MTIAPPPILFIELSPDQCPFPLSLEGRGGRYMECCGQHIVGGAYCLDHQKYCIDTPAFAESIRRAFRCRS